MWFRFHNSVKCWGCAKGTHISFCIPAKSNIYELGRYTASRNFVSLILSLQNPVWDWWKPVSEFVPSIYPELWKAISEYNRGLYESGQEGIHSLRNLEESCFTMSSYGVESDAFGVLSIPALELEMPIYLGASSYNMSLGAAQLGQTSIPIGGVNTNSVIAGHRGWNGADYFRYIPNLVIGDKIQITNLWETLEYTVTGTKIISPNDVEAIKIQPGKDMITLFTCHPYASGGRQRYLVFCERTTTD